MEIVNVPIIDFYRYCLDCAYERQFLWVLCLLAREADAEMSYIQIQKYWSSLHDLTGNQILFVFAGALKGDDSSVLYHESESWRGLRNSMMHIVDKNVPTIPYYKYPKIDLDGYTFNSIKTNHTCSISDLRDYLGLSEKEIPSLVFTPTHPLVQNKHIVISINGENIYQEIKNIIENLEEPLKKLKEQQNNYMQIETQLLEISHNIEILNCKNKVHKRYVKAKTNIELTKLQTKKSRLNLDLENLKNQIILSHIYLKERIEKASNITNQNNIKSGIGKKRFKIAFSFPGEYRDMVFNIAKGVADVFSEELVLYDMFHSAEFARPNLDTYLQDLYINESELIVIFICSAYNRKEWCGIEWRAIRDLLNSKKADDRILFIKCGEGEIDGFFDTVDGCIDLTKTETNKIIQDIISRYNSLANSLNGQ